MRCYSPELLLKLVDKSLVDLAEALQHWEWHEDDDSLASAELDLLGSSDLQVLQISLDSRAADLKSMFSAFLVAATSTDLDVVQLLSNLVLELSGSLASGLLDLVAKQTIRIMQWYQWVVRTQPCYAIR